MLASVATVPTAEAQYTRPGSSTATFLSIDVSPRAASMAGAYIAVPKGAEAMYYNPSALPWQSDGTHVMLAHTNYFNVVNHQYLAASRNFGNVGTFGVAVTALYTNEMKERTPLQQDGTGATFYAGGMRTSIGYGRFLTSYVSFGGKISLISMRLYEGFVQHAVAVDIAASYRSGFRGFQFGLMISNVGSDIKFVQEAYPLPTNFTFGARIRALEWQNQKLELSASASKPNQGGPVWQVGTEYGFNDLLFLRGGYRFMYDAQTYSLGGGVDVDIAGYGLAIDYSYSAWGKSVLGNVHRVGARLAL